MFQPLASSTASTWARSASASEPGAGAAAGGRLRHAQRQVGGAHHVAAPHDHRALDRVLQLAHVARPGVGGERVAAPPGEKRIGRRLIDCAKLREEVLGQHRHVLRPLAQRRDVDLHHVQPPVEVLAEARRP